MTLKIRLILCIDKDAYRVTCSANYMRIDLDRRYYNSSKYKSITLMSPSCKHTLSYDYITLGCIPGQCESEKKETATEIVYVNAVKLTRNFGSGKISRENDETIRFRCSYKRDTVINNRASFDPVGKISVSLRKLSFKFFRYFIIYYQQVSIIFCLPKLIVTFWFN